MFPAIICTFADYADEEDVWRWFQSGGASIMNEVVSQPIDSDWATKSSTSARSQRELFHVRRFTAAITSVNFVL